MRWSAATMFVLLANACVFEAPPAIPAAEPVDVGPGTDLPDVEKLWDAWVADVAPTDAGSIEDATEEDATQDDARPAEAGEDPIDAGEADVEENADAFVPMIPHLDPADVHFGTADLTMSGGIIDTDSLSIDGLLLPTGIRFETAAQQPGGPELAVLSMSRFEVVADTTVMVRGTRPLVILASDEVSIAGTLAANAIGSQHGPGGADPGAGTGAGTGGSNGGSTLDSGGSGAGFGESGGKGGPAGTAGSPSAGHAYGDASLTSLEGGSGGSSGASTYCTEAPGGAGGGAVQIFSAIRIRVTGVINAGGGGGAGGRDCGYSAGAGSGGGSGGAIFLQSPAIEIEGAVAANGGGGGGGGDATGAGWAGLDGRPSADIAGGGAGTFDSGGNGGAGGARGAPAAAGIGDENGGGGGGGVGRIVLLLPIDQTASSAGVISPDAVIAFY